MSLTDHSAPGAAAAFSYQFERAMQRLAQSPSGCRIGIETLDDVSAVHADGTVALEQNKHSIQPDKSPFGDRSRDLWNTLAIWMDALERREVIGGQTVFYLVTNKLLADDCLARALGNARTPEQVDACISALAGAMVEPPKGTADLCKYVLDTTRRDLLMQLVSSIEVIDGSGGPPLRNATIGYLQIPGSCKEQADALADELLGWIHKEALLAWQAQKAAWISRDHFVNRLHAALESRRRAIQRERSEHLLPVPEDQVGHEKGRPFVRQLHLITDDESVVEGSIRDFLRCNIEKMRLSSEGNITDDDWLAFEAALTRRWQAIQARVKRNSADQVPADIGWEIFSDTTENYCEKLAGQDTEQGYLTAGSYHRLADIPSLGWHPDWRNLMKEPEDS